MKKKRFTFLVTMDVEPEANEADVKGYIESACVAWKGQLLPPGAPEADEFGYDPMYDCELVSVVNQKRVRKGK